MCKFISVDDHKLWVTLFMEAYNKRAMALSITLPEEVVTIGMLQRLHAISTEFYYDLIDLQRVNGRFLFVYGIESPDKFGY